MKYKSAFTMLELLVALAMLTTAMAITFSTFYSITRAWQRGTVMADNLNRGGFVMEQLAAGLRSAFYPPPGTNSQDAISDFGFWLEDSGSGPNARAVISWVKTGGDLLPPESPFQKGLHRIMISVENDDEARPALAARAWRPYTSMLDDDPADGEPFFIAGKVTGLECRVSTNMDDKGWEWADAWEGPDTNTLPLAVEISVYLEPLEQGEENVELKRTIVIPVAPYARAPQPPPQPGRQERPEPVEPE